MQIIVALDQGWRWMECFKSESKDGYYNFKMDLFAAGCMRLKGLHGGIRSRRWS